MSQKSWGLFNELLEDIFRELNANNGPKTPLELWGQYGERIKEIKADEDVRNQLIEMGHDIFVPRSYEAIRLLANLRQRMNSTDRVDKPLVAQIRAETILRQRPIRNISASKITGTIGRILAVIGGKPSYSEFQYRGWEKVWDTIDKNNSLVIVAPTGSGKTEVFMLPTIYNIATKLADKNPPRYIMIYPRVELLKDQLARIFKYAYYAERQHQPKTQNLFNSHQSVDNPIVIGMQFGGILSSYTDTQKPDNKVKIFDDDGIFQLVSSCPICDDNNRQGRLKIGQATKKVVPLICTNPDCGATFHVTIGKNDHVEAHIKPHILVTTIESLDRLYLNPKLEEYITNIQGLIFDEVHLYHSLYGAHVHNVIKRLEEIQKHGQPLFKIASSATVYNPERFIARLFYGKEFDERVEIHTAKDYPNEPAGVETAIFLQATENNFPNTQSTFIQTVMAVGHGILGQNERTLIFTESIDHADRSFRQIFDAEQRKQLWRFRLIVDEILFQGEKCPKVAPHECQIYLNGECWRGARGGIDCYTSNVQLIDEKLELGVIHSKTKQKDYWSHDVVIATPVLEVGVDDERFRATVHYRTPRSVFSFLQRRGRAGRGSANTAYTIVVLGKSPSDEFYFRRRNRLMDSGKFELPLNPNNSVIQEMHRQITQERQKIVDLKNKYSNLSSSILLWMFEKFDNCITLNDLYGKLFQNWQMELIKDNIHQNIHKKFTGWIGQEKERFNRYMELEILLQELITRIPENQRNIAIDFRELVYIYRSNQTGYDELKKLASSLLKVLADLSLDEEDDLQQEIYERLTKIVKEIFKDQKKIGEFRGDSNLISSLYDFFNLLNNTINEEQYRGTLNRVEDMIKIVMQSLFYIGNHCLDTHPNCPSCLSYFTPDAYFQEVKPIIIETWSNRGKQLDDIYSEDITKLSGMLLPYKTFYRYFSESDSMAVIRMTTNSDWVHHTPNGIEVRVQIHAEGKRQNGGIDPTKIHVVPIKTDEEGQGVVKLCRTCYRLHNATYNGHCGCQNSDIVPVKLYSEPIIGRSAKYNQLHRISDTFYYSDRLEGTVYIYGANVQYTIQNRKPDGSYASTPGNRDFQAHYYQNGDHPEPIIYNLNTRGIIWDLSNIVTELVQDINLKKQLPQSKQLSANLILHTAAHMLHKAVASISGVNDIVLEYAIVEEKSQVVIWERYEGGVGISEIVKDIILEDPKLLYRELLASFLCPVFYSEESNWLGSDENLKTHLTETWALTDEDDLLLVEGVVGEVLAERKAILSKKAEEHNACSEADGCPACIHLTVCTDHLEQPDHVSRLVAEAIMNYFRQQVDNTRLNTINSYRHDQGLGSVVRLRDDIDRDLFDVVCF